MGLKILFTPSDNNLAGAFQSMVRLCILLRDKYGCDVLVLLRRNGRGEELLKENGIRYLKIKSYNWIIPDHPSVLAYWYLVKYFWLLLPFYDTIKETAVISYGKTKKVQNQTYG